MTLPQSYNDPGFEAFRKELGDIARRKDRAALATKTVVEGFFWIGDTGDKTNKRESGIDNLAAAIGLDNQDGLGWDILADAADEATLEPIPDKDGVMCSPAVPVFDQRAAEQAAKATGTQPGDWAFPAKGSLDVHVAGNTSSPVIEKVGAGRGRCVVVWRLMESALGDQSLREIVGELQARHETAPAVRASSRHNQLSGPTLWQEKSYRAWWAKPAAEIVPCDCGWRPDLGDHYRVHRPGPIVRRTTRHGVRSAH